MWSEDLRSIDFNHIHDQAGDRARDRHCGEMTEVCVTEDKTDVVVVASYHSVSRNPVRFKALLEIDTTSSLYTSACLFKTSSCFSSLSINCLSSVILFVLCKACFSSCNCSRRGRRNCSCSSSKS